MKTKVDIIYGKEADITQVVVTHKRSKHIVAEFHHSSKAYHSAKFLNQVFSDIRTEAMDESYKSSLKIIEGLKNANHVSE